MFDVVVEEREVKKVKVVDKMSDFDVGWYLLAVSC